ncbi:MAG: pilus (MSHA type) biogenesis protein MshL [Algicola sp.]|nr:pilus (MSHA type) biogenesis protein MshL [Algicola sp.]
MNRPLINIVIICLFLSGCQTTGPVVLDDIQEELNPNPRGEAADRPFEVPDMVIDDILSGQSSGGILISEDPHFHVVAQGVDVRPFFASLVEGTPYSVIVHPQVKGSVSLDLKDVTLIETIDVLREIYGFDIRKRGNIWTVRSAGLRTETLSVDYLMLTRNGSSSVTVNAGGVSQAAGGGNGQNGGGGNNQGGNQQSGNNNGGNTGSGQNGGQQGGNQSSSSNIQTTSTTDFWQDLQSTLQTMLGIAVTQSSSNGDTGGGGTQQPANDGRMVIVSPMTGLVTVKAYPNEILIVKEFLQRSEQTLRRQVILETKIVEVSLSDEYQQGINWQQAFSHLNTTDFIINNTAGTAANAISAALGGVTSIRFLNDDFTGVISLLETQGNVQILSSPRVTATNNQKAVIKVGQDEYFVTDVSTTTTTGNATTTTPELTLTPFFSGIALDVTPQINEHGEVILHIHPSVTETSEQEKVVRLSGETIVLPLAKSNIRESDTIIRAKSGEIVVIGGLMQTTLTESHSKTPFFSDIPFIGELFTQKSEVERKKELVILVKATVVGAGTWKQQLERSSDLLKRWYAQE